MAASAPTPLLPPVPFSSSAAAFLKRSVVFWSGSERSTAWFWTLGALGLIFANLAVNVGINRWNKSFFDALEKTHGAQWIVEITAIANFFGFVSGICNAFEVPAPEGGDALAR